MKLPWVSRGRFEDLQKRLEEVKAERDQYLNRLLSRAQTEPDEEEKPESTTGAPVSFNTPIDRLLNRFDQALKSGSGTAQFKARA